MHTPKGNLQLKLQPMDLNLLQQGQQLTRSLTFVQPWRYLGVLNRIPSTTPGAEPPGDAKDSGSARSHSTHLETSSSTDP